MGPMQRRSLEWLSVFKMHLQENTLFDPDLAVNVTQNVAHYQFKVATSNSFGEVAVT